MERNKLSYEMSNFIRPIFVGEAKKGMPAGIFFINIVAAIMMLHEQVAGMCIIYAALGVILAIGGLFIINLEGGWIQKAFYGACESVFLLLCAYLATYMDYSEAGYNLGPYMLYTQLIGGGVFITFVLLLLYRLKKPAKGLNEADMERSIKRGLVLGVGIVIVIFGGLILLYCTVFKRNIHLVESSKMLYVAMCLNALAAYYILKAVCCIKYRVAINAVCNEKGKKKRR